MADFGLFAIAAEKALGLYPGEFMQVFERNRESSRQVILEASPLAEAIQALLNQELNWKGTSTQLLRDLEPYAEESVVRSRYWPKASNSLKRQLNRLKPDLEAVGISMNETRQGKEGARLIYLEKFSVADRDENIFSSWPNKDQKNIVSYRQPWEVKNQNSLIAMLLRLTILPTIS
ncbi:MAG: hypothetical protein HC940_06435 [Acaryochloris sp. SU_5_25]|nr:hypothetical protein [Acaryochloris sp. SU_5_25]